MCEKMHHWLLKIFLRTLASKSIMMVVVWEVRKEGSVQSDRTNCPLVTLSPVEGQDCCMIRT